MRITQKQLTEIIEEIGRCRSRVMDDCELELGGSPRWQPLRSRILKVFGERGLEGKIISIISGAVSNDNT